MGFVDVWLIKQLSGRDGRRTSRVKPVTKNMIIFYRLLLEPVISKPVLLPKCPPSFSTTLVNEEIYLPQLLRISILNCVNTCNLWTFAYNVGSKGNLNASLLFLK